MGTISNCGESKQTRDKPQPNGSLQSLAIRHLLHFYLDLKVFTSQRTAKVAMSIPQFATFRRFVLTGSIAAVTATGAWYGAGLKMKQDIRQVYFSLSLPPPSSLPLPAFPSAHFCIFTYLFSRNRKNKKQQKQHRSNKSPNWKPIVRTSCKRKSCWIKRSKSWRSRRGRKREGDLKS